MFLYQKMCTDVPSGLWEHWFTGDTLCEAAHRLLVPLKPGIFSVSLGKLLPCCPLCTLCGCHAPRFWLEAANAGTTVWYVTPTIGGHADTYMREKAAFVGHQGRTAPPVNGRGGQSRAPLSIQPPSALTANARELPRRRSCSNYQPSNTACNNVILLHTDLMAIQLHQHGPVCSNLCLFNRKAHPKNADWLQTAIYSNYPSPRSLFPSREQSLLTLSYKIAFCQRLRRY